jgi:hypothetical protein
MTIIKLPENDRSLVRGVVGIAMFVLTLFIGLILNSPSRTDSQVPNVRLSAVHADWPPH